MIKIKRGKDIIIKLKYEAAEKRYSKTCILNSISFFQSKMI
jgi:hypothetical protein